MRIFGKISLVLASVLLLGACMSEDSINDPLPRMSKEKAEKWAKHWTESMARTAKAEIVPKSHTANFSKCIGKNNEIADDGRFNLSYHIRAKLSKERHADAIRAVRDKLEEEGFEIVGYRSDPKVRPANLVDAKHPKQRHFVSAGDVSDDLLTLIVRTPCLLPPGVKQQQL
ncbi:hypothetical protein [Streptomyces albus]|uniref:hypothetical protein n=1 Tax=Streptomyces albus TaxID=1888 RepID=UPI001FC91C27|nr:hypothetical protein [Streptomyces albus]